MRLYIFDVPVDRDQHDDSVEQVLEFEEGPKVIVAMGKEVDGLVVVSCQTLAGKACDRAVCRENPFAHSLLQAKTHTYTDSSHAGLETRLPARTFELSTYKLNGEDSRHRDFSCV
jgi:hypothetical protein